LTTGDISDIDVHVRRILPIHQVVDKISGRLTRIPLGNRPEFSDPRYLPKEFNLDYFQRLERTNFDGQICFVDGGNSPIFSAPNFSVQLVRTYFNLFKGGERINPRHLPQRIEFYAICYAVNDGGRIFYESELVPMKEEFGEFLPDTNDLRFDSFDATIVLGPMRAPIHRVAETARQFAEWKFLGLAIESELESGDVVVRDGTLQTVVTKERKYANIASNIAVEKNVNLISLSKTSTLFTSTGYPLMAAISELAEKSKFKDASWYYHPIVEIRHPDHQAEMFAVKLHPSSDYVFRLEFLNRQAKMNALKDFEAIMGALSANSDDLTFPGYPYGLLDADRFSKVSPNEAGNQAIQFLSCATDKGALARLNRCLKASNAHDILNNFGG
jgi:hypothetical protein